MENAVQGDDTQPADNELRKTLKTLEKGDSFSQFFSGVSILNFTTNAYGPSLYLRISRKQRVPVQVVQGQPARGTTGRSNLHTVKY